MKNKIFTKSQDLFHHHFFFTDHDDRTARMDDDHPMEFGGVKPRVSFKNPRFGRDRVRHVNSVSKDQIAEAMSSSTSVRQVMFKPRSRGKGGRLSPMVNRGPRLNIKSRVNLNGEAQWYKIMVRICFSFFFFIHFTLSGDLMMID